MNTCLSPPCLAVSTTDCQADVAFVADSSRSITELEWFMTKQFIIDTALGLKAANDKSRVSVVSFSTTVGGTVDSVGRRGIAVSTWYSVSDSNPPAIASNVTQVR